MEGITTITAIVPDILSIYSQQGKPVVVIKPDGRIFWHEREVETDDDFRAAMLELRNVLMGRKHDHR